MADDAGDLYAILGVDQKATPEEIRTAYRRIAMECHPDRTQNNPESAERFKVISQAYEVLANPEMRAEYDRMVADQPFPIMEVVDTVGVIIGSVMGGVRARKEGRKIPKDACPTCQGEGELVVDLSVISFSRVCPLCNGSKKVPKESPSMAPKQTT